MRKEWILTEEEKCLKRRKIERNRIIKQQAQMVFHQQPNETVPSNAESDGHSNEVSTSMAWGEFNKNVKDGDDDVSLVDFARGWEEYSLRD